MIPSLMLPAAATATFSQESKIITVLWNHKRKCLNVASKITIVPVPAIVYSPAFHLKNNNKEKRVKQNCCIKRKKGCGGYNKKRKEVYVNYMTYFSNYLKKYIPENFVMLEYGKCCSHSSQLGAFREIFYTWTEKYRHLQTVRIEYC